MSRPLSDLAVQFRKLPQEISLSNLRKAARIAGQYIADDMKNRAAKDSGDMADSIMVAIERGATIDQVVAKVGPSKKTAWRAHFIEFGVRPHVIKAKAGGVLRSGDSVTKNSRTFSDETVSGKFFGSVVNHPGIAARPFIRPALDENAAEAAAIFAGQLDQMIRKAFA